LEEKNGNKLMHIKSRETEDASLALRFAIETGGWSVEGDADEVAQTGARKDIQRLLKDANSPMYPAAIAKGLGRNPNTVRVHLMKMRNDGILHTLADGAYWFPNRPVPDEYMSKPVFGTTGMEPQAVQSDDDIPIHN
jgi:hypothetical protein